jgi:cephalosporin hydroxylase
MLNSDPGALQNPTELEWLIGLFRTENVRSYLEIGSMYGGSLWQIASALPQGSKIVSVDLPQVASWDSLQRTVDRLIEMGYDTHLFKGDSKDAKIIKNVTALGPFDACLIDGDHLMNGVKSDWNNYGPLSRIVAFHDINWWRDEKWTPPRLGVPSFWQELKKQYRHDEIRSEKHDRGIGVLWRY